MSATLHVLRPDTPPIAGFLRIGHTGHRKLAELHAAGRFPFRRAVFDASHLDEQKDLLATLKASGCEIVLDPNTAEMATVGRFGSAVNKLPWANPDRPWTPDDFGPTRNLDTAKAIADFAVASGAHAVLAPGHLIETVEDGWRGVDLRLLDALRRELDRAGGAHIAIDHQLITTAALLKEPGARAALIADLADLPVHNLWVRASGFGATATGAGTRSVVEALRSFHAAGRPIVVDLAGGFAGLAVAAFGAAGGIAHGVGQKEGFKAGDWKKPPQPGRGGGAATRTYVHELDRYFKEDQLQAIFDAKGGRSRFGCADTSCCPHGVQDMIENAHTHFLTQRSRQLDDLSSVPELRRADHFLLRHLDLAVRSARHAEKLKIDDEKVLKNVAQAKSRLIRLRDALGDLQAQGEAETRSRAPAFRGGIRPTAAVMGGR